MPARDRDQDGYPTKEVHRKCGSDYHEVVVSLEERLWSVGDEPVICSGCIDLRLARKGSHERCLYVEIDEIRIEAGNTCNIRILSF